MAAAGTSMAHHHTPMKPRSIVQAGAGHMVGHCAVHHSCSGKDDQTEAASCMHERATSSSVQPAAAACQSPTARRHALHRPQLQVALRHAAVDRQQLPRSIHRQVCQLGAIDSQAGCTHGAAALRQRLQSRGPCRGCELSQSLHVGLRDGGYCAAHPLPQRQRRRLEAPAGRAGRRRRRRRRWRRRRRRGLRGRPLLRG